MSRYYGHSCKINEFIEMEKICDEYMWIILGYLNYQKRTAIQIYSQYVISKVTSLMITLSYSSRTTFKNSTEGFNHIY